MIVRQLSLKDFRNYAEAHLTFEPGLNALIGRNGQGKTNIVEAVMFFATLKSHRTGQDTALIRAGQESATLQCKLMQRGREALLEVQLNRNAPNKMMLNRHSVRPREISQMISAVMFAPEDLTIVRGEPSVRRRFLDDSLMLRHPVAAGALTDYERVLRQRTTLLRDARARGDRAGVDALLDVWDEQLVDLGSQIIAHRRMLVRDLQNPLISSYFTLVEEDHQPTLQLEESVVKTLGVSRETIGDEQAADDVSRETIARMFREALSHVREKELERGQTLIGPHRDDLELGLNGLPVKGYASHGESWSVALALKLALALVLREDSVTGDPVLLLDDVFAELDEGRRGRLFEAVQTFEQVLVTAAVAGDIPNAGDWHTTHIHAGEVLAHE